MVAVQVMVASDPSWQGGFTVRGPGLEDAKALGWKLAHTWADVVAVRVLDEGHVVAWLCGDCGTWQPDDPEGVECRACAKLC